MLKGKIENRLRKAFQDIIRVYPLLKKQYPRLSASMVEVFVPEKEVFGHYSTNAAIKLSKIINKNPMEFAEELAKKIKIGEPDFFEKIEILPPGFINFWLSPKVFQNELKEILKKKNNYGKPVRQSKNKKVQIEFVSANPTGPLTLANGRGGFLGDVLANILEFYGHKVEREYYINDTGNQIITLGKSLSAAAGLIPWEENFYQGDYIKDWAKKNSVLIKKHKNNYLKIGQSAAKDFLASIKKVLTKDSKIRFDRFTSENRHIHKKNFTKKALAIFEKSELTYKKDGALWLKTTRFGDDKDRVLITGDGFPTYFLADAGHYLETKKRGFNHKINIMGPDHYGYVKRIQATAKIMEFKNSEIIITQAVRLIKEGQELKMSKRKGEFVAFSDLISEIGADVARFFFLTHSPETHMDFDLDLAKERSMKNPVYYVQYAAVRCQGIIKKARLQTINYKLQTPLNLLDTKEDINLIKTLARFPEIVDETVGKLSPQILVHYVFTLAREFHNFYEKEKVVGEEKKLATARLALIAATLFIFKNIFSLLGISLPKKM